MERVTTMAKKARYWLTKEIVLFGKNKTLREMMAERGLDEYGRKNASDSAKLRPYVALQPPEPTSATAPLEVKFVAAFSYDTLGQVTVEVTDVKQWAFCGRSRLDASLQSYSWNKVRGLIKVVETGEMLTPVQVLDRYF